MYSQAVYYFVHCDGSAEKDTYNLSSLDYFLCAVCFATNHFNCNISKEMLFERHTNSVPYKTKIIFLNARGWTLI